MKIISINKNINTKSNNRNLLLKKVMYLIINL